ncbi:nicotinate-nucleotide adenylyltransferase [Noviherbaspirillum cavernae]|uniref:Probable nicotinate-nucleotide adenylyltransferase n=1 Tax=Noviherbaspirillum cavernae TaxID=2320862 RepID=A0A418X3C2_9BURK|nr:nicotinate-nucleotide adenylyltransferase [Noviherbaspirillum cavernae]RJG06949.1 nicotinate-nucleotide adenylyltransferase [Noviherbaspirillum cavernae]
MGVNAHRRCVAILGGSFDPVHNGHVALVAYFAKLLFPDEVRIIPAGNPWQKGNLQASAEDRLHMLRLAYDKQAFNVTIDRQEIERHGASYTIDTLRAIRAETGPDTSIAFLIGADQLQKLNTWKDWQRLFDYAHICAASRPGFALDAGHVPAEVAREFARRAATPQQIRETSHGLTCLATNLAIDISATEIRAALQREEQPESLIPPAVLDYIKHHHLYTHQAY